MDENKNQLLNSNNERRWFRGSPLSLCYTELYKSASTGALFAKVKFMNVQPEQIKAVSFDIICYGIIRNEIGRIENYTIGNLEVDRNECFADSEIINIENNDTMAVDVILKSATAQNGQTWTNDEHESFKLPLKQNNISSYMGRYFEELKTEWAENGLKVERLLYAPIIKEDYWLCACGTLNWGVEDKCCECGAKLEWLAEVTDVSIRISNEDTLKRQSIRSEKSSSMSYDKLYKHRQQESFEYERKNALKHKNKKKVKIITGLTATLLIFVVLTLGVYFIITPASNYYTAVSLIHDGKYDEAVAELEKLDGYGDSEEQIKRAKYLKAEKLKTSSNFLEASNIFYALGDYNDSQQKYFETMYEYGEQQLSADNYITSLKVFRELGDYEGAAAKASESEKAALNAASKMFEERQYSNASEMFREIADITGNSEADDKAKLALRHEADKLYANGKYTDAIKIYQSLSGYDHIDVTLKKLNNLAKILSTSIHIGDDVSVWESVGLPCSYCHASDTLSYQFSFKANGLYEFNMYCSNHSGNTINKLLQGQYKIEDDKIYTLNHIGGNTKWVELATIENITSDNTEANKNAKMVVTNPFFTKSKSALTLYGNIADQNSSPI